MGSKGKANEFCFGPGEVEMPMRHPGGVSSGQLVV